MGTVRTNEQGLIPFDKFIDMFRIMRKHSKKRLDKKLEEITNNRRELLAKD